MSVSATNCRLSSAGPASTLKLHSQKLHGNDLVVPKVSRSKTRELVADERRRNVCQLEQIKKVIANVRETIAESRELIQSAEAIIRNRRS